MKKLGRVLLNVLFAALVWPVMAPVVAIAALVVAIVGTWSPVARAIGWQMVRVLFHVMLGFAGIGRPAAAIDTMSGGPLADLMTGATLQRDNSPARVARTSKWLSRADGTPARAAGPEVKVEQ